VARLDQTVILEVLENKEILPLIVQQIVASRKSLLQQLYHLHILLILLSSCQRLLLLQVIRSLNLHRSRVTQVVVVAESRLSKSKPDFLYLASYV